MRRWLLVPAALAAVAAVPGPGAAQERLIIGMSRDALGATWSVRPDGRDLRSLQAISTLPTTSWTYVEVSPNGRDGVVGTLSTSTEVVVGDRVVAASDDDGGGRFAPDGSAVVIGTRDGGRLVVALPGGATARIDGPVRALAWSPDATTVAAATEAGLVLVPAAGGARRLVPWATPLDDGPVALAWSPDAAAVARADRAGAVALDLAAGTWSTILAGPSRAVAYAPDGRHVAVIQDDGAHVLTAAGAPVAVVPGASVAWSPDGRRLAVVGVDGVRVATATGEPVATLAGTSVAWSPDGRRLAYTAAGRLLIAAPDGAGARALTRPDERVLRIDAWLADARPLPPDRVAPRAVPDLGHGPLVHGWFRDTTWSTPPASARISVVRRANRRCSALTARGLRRMSCARAARTWVAARLTTGENGLRWAAPRRLRPAEYRVRVRAADRAGNVTRAPTPWLIEVR